MFLFLPAFGIGNDPVDLCRCGDRVSRSIAAGPWRVASGTTRERSTGPASGNEAASIHGRWRLAARTPPVPGTPGWRMGRREGSTVAYLSRPMAAFAEVAKTDLVQERNGLPSRAPLERADITPSEGAPECLPDSRGRKPQTVRAGNAAVFWTTCVWRRSVALQPVLAQDVDLSGEAARKDQG